MLAVSSRRRSLRGPSSKVVVRQNSSSGSIHNPNAPSTSVRCSSATSCASSANADIIFSSAANCDSRIEVRKGSTDVCWKGGGGPKWDLVRGDLKCLVFGTGCSTPCVNGSNPGGCFKQAVETITPTTDRCIASNTTGLPKPVTCPTGYRGFTDPRVTNPLSGNGFFYVLRSKTNAGTVPVSASYLGYNDGTQANGSGNPPPTGDRNHGNPGPSDGILDAASTCP